MGGLGHPSDEELKCSTKVRIGGFGIPRIVLTLESLGPFIFYHGLGVYEGFGVLPFAQEEGECIAEALGHDKPESYSPKSWVS
jgi:hypothetical protein